MKHKFANHPKVQLTVVLGYPLQDAVEPGIPRLQKLQPQLRLGEHIQSPKQAQQEERNLETDNNTKKSKSDGYERIKMYIYLDKDIKKNNNKESGISAYEMKSLT